MNKKVEFNKIDRLISNMRENIQESLLSAIKYLGEIFERASAGEEERNKLYALAEKCVAYHFVFPIFDDDLNIYTFNITAQNIKKLYSIYANGEKFNSVIEGVYKLEHANKMYIDEAIAAFKRKQYLSCSLLLFAILDCEHLYSNKNNTNKKRLINQKTVDEKLSVCRDKKQLSLSYFGQINALLMLRRLYEYGKDFEQDASYLQRNYVSHGMYKNKVTKYDCIMLFILCSLVSVFKLFEKK